MYFLNHRIGNIPLAGVVVRLALALVAPAVRARAGADAVRAQAAKAWRSQSGGGPGRVHAQVWGRQGGGPARSVQQCVTRAYDRNV